MTRNTRLPCSVSLLTGLSGIPWTHAIGRLWPSVRVWEAWLHPTGELLPCSLALPTDPSNHIQMLIPGMGK